MLRRIFLLLICCSLCGFAQSKHPFTFEDMMQLKRIGEPSVSPDGKWVAFSAVDVNLEANTKIVASVDRADRRWRTAAVDAR
jgi:dipeptidyl aminopeptidase/acylaminoacyl peptidase